MNFIFSIEVRFNRRGALLRSSLDGFLVRVPVSKLPPDIRQKLEWQVAHELLSWPSAALGGPLGGDGVTVSADWYVPVWHYSQDEGPPPMLAGIIAGQYTGNDDWRYGEFLPSEVVAKIQL